MQAYFFFIWSESYNIKGVSHIEERYSHIFPLLAFLQLTIYGKFMTLLCTIPSKAMILDNQMPFLWKYILALPRLVSFFFFYLGWIITPHFLSESIGNGLMEVRCLLHRYFLHVNSVDKIASPAAQLACISWILGNIELKPSVHI